MTRQPEFDTCDIIETPIECRGHKLVNAGFLQVQVISSLRVNGQSCSLCLREQLIKPTVSANHPPAPELLKSQASLINVRQPPGSHTFPTQAQFSFQIFFSSKICINKHPFYFQIKDKMLANSRLTCMRQLEKTFNIIYYNAILI